ncbi:MAG: helix-turn-helix domain-containing protein [bacterium]|nr:helix-turn-helix domain-containing protein [bacterium]
MAKNYLKQQAIKLRLAGHSYSQIKQKIGVSKSTLSGWLEKFPLSEKRIRELRDNNPRRIEHYRNTMREKKEIRLRNVYEIVSKDIGSFTKRDLFLAGLFLYWGEGTKSQDSIVTVTNTNPAMLQFFIRWLQLLGVKRKDLKVKLHLYSDMNIKQSIDFWSRELKIPTNRFYKTYVKKTCLESITYRNGFGKGTCSVIFGNKPLWEYISMGLKYLSESGEQNFRP